jgi:hypothetical protein
MKQRERREAAALEATLRRFYERSPAPARDVDDSPRVS